MSEDNESNKKNETKRPRRRWWVKALIGLGVTVGVILVLLLVVITVAVSYLKPERLTPLVEKYANEYLDAKVSLDRVEISFWSTFPKFELDVRGLEIKSKALDKLPAEVRARLPLYADSLASIRHFNGAVNIPKLSLGEIALYDIVIENPRFNVVQATPEKANYDIFPSSDTKDDDKSDDMPVPSISFGTFKIVDDMPVRYFSLPDTTDIAVTLTTTTLEGAEAPVYAIELDGVTDASLAGMKLYNLRFGIGGDLRWDKSEPMQVELDKFKVQLGNVLTETSAKVDFKKDLTVETLQFILPETKVDDIIALVPESMRGELDKVNTNLSVGADMRLTSPYRPAVDSIPSFDLALKIPEGRLEYENLKLSRLSLEATANIDGGDLDKSKVDLKRLVAIGEGVGFELNAKATALLTDPAVEGTFKGGVEIQRLPKKLLAKLPCQLTGSLRADSKFNLRKSYLDRANFHRIRLTGDACLKNFKLSMPELPAEIYARDIDLKLGTNSGFTRGEVSVDSLLTASLKIDTISANVTGMTLQGRGLKVGVGCRNIASSVDTTVVNPIGGRIEVEQLYFKSEQDSMRVRLKDATIGGLVRRYKGDKHKPQLALSISAGRAMYGDRLTRALLSDASVRMTAYPQTLRVPKRMQARMDSLRALYPQLPPDSIFRMALPKGFGKMIHDSAAIAEGQVMDLEVDNSVRQLLRKWDARGSLQARRVGVFTRMFPVRNRLSDLNIRFNTDSVVITDTKYRAGKSDFLINGTISNLRRALTTASTRQSLKINLDMQSDTIDVNEIAAAVFAGAAYLDTDTTGMVAMVPDTDDEEKLQASVDVASDTMAVLVVPSNIEAVFNIKARNILYSDLAFRDFTGTMNVYNGAINLNQLAASTDIGSIDLNALYNAPTRRDVSFAFGMQVKDFRVARFLNLVPAIDSLMPLLNDIDGIINADIAATTDLDSAMNIEIPTLRAAVKLSGDSLKVVDEATFRTIGKWLLFKHKEHNMIDHMAVEMIIDNSQLRMFPFMFYLDRYKLGVSGTNDLAMNLNYHIAVLKSPLPFKFGINISGNVDDMKIRLGRAKFNEKEMAKTVSIADTTRVNLVREIQNVFRRGVRNSKLKRLDFNNVATQLVTDEIDASPDTLSHADSTYFIKEGLIPAPDTIPATPAVKVTLKDSKKKK